MSGLPRLPGWTMLNCLGKLVAEAGPAMKAHACPLCGARMKRSGTTSAGRTRWRHTSYGASSERRIDSAAKLQDALLDWLLT